MIARVHHALNDRVLVFDEKGKLLLAYQGQFKDVVDKILQDATESTKFYIEGFSFPVHRDLFKEKKLFNIIKGGKK
jgi:hypothetical protein